ncbi:glycosyltransferase [Thioalkalivibrio sp.]|uniref:glycosyltransferase n=1 Tax=Thioalkalivibrio sp. TaxID=2093813 RepID=UPI003564B5F4
MKILIATNTFTPHVGGVARSVEAFAGEYRHRGHQVLVLAPEFPDMPADEADVIRIPAIQNFNASDFSVVLPLHPGLSEQVDAFGPDLVHAQHPFLLGSTALRLARRRDLPLVFTHHTLYEQYTHYVPGDSPALKRFAIELATQYANLCSQVFAPSESIRDIIRQRGVTVPIDVIPTGVRVRDFADGDGMRFRRRMGLPEAAVVIGHLGRLAPEKNLAFLARAVARVAGEDPRVHFLVVGTGPSESVVRACFEDAGLEGRLHIAGVCEGEDLADALHAMDLFAFASTSETQGMVLTEAMAAGLPVVGLDAPGVREVVSDRRNGRLVHDEDEAAFAAALAATVGLPQADRRALSRGARATAVEFSMDRSAERALARYAALLERRPEHREGDEGPWTDLMKAITTEWDILNSVAGAGDAALRSDEQGRPER